MYSQTLKPSTSSIFAPGSSGEDLTAVAGTPGDGGAESVFTGVCWTSVCSLGVELAIASSSFSLFWFPGRRARRAASSLSKAASSASNKAFSALFLSRSPGVFFGAESFLTISILYIIIVIFIDLLMFQAFFLIQKYFAASLVRHCCYI